MPRYPMVYLPHNVQEHDNMLRAMIVGHMGTAHGNPTQWVVDAMHECWQRAYAEGLAMGKQMRPAAQPDVSVVARRIEFVGEEPAEVHAKVGRRILRSELPPGMRDEDITDV